jgi:prepilin-type N-terminal cleavage/methylation domain-containing protein
MEAIMNDPRLVEPGHGRGRSGDEQARALHAGPRSRFRVGHDLGRRGKRASFTLIELLTVMTIMAIMLGVAIAAFKDIGRGAGFRGAILQFKSATSLARQYAVTKRSPTWLHFENVDTATGERGLYYLATSEDDDHGLIGKTNYFVSGVVFTDPETGTPYGISTNIRFNIDGTCGARLSNFEPYIDLAITELGPRGTSVVTRIYGLTGRVKVMRTAN